MDPFFSLEQCLPPYSLSWEMTEIINLLKAMLPNFSKMLDMNLL